MAVIELDNELLRKLQLAELEMIVEVDRICRKHGIKYSLDGGTLLGAIRHKGFIPWDDDADVVMTRAEYEKFSKACKEDLNTEKFFLQDFSTDPEYRWGYSKMRKNGTVFIRSGQEHGRWNQSVNIDVFVYDNVPDNKLIRPFHLFRCYCIRKGLYSEAGKVDAPNAFLRTWYKLVNKIPREHWIKAIDKLAARTNKHKTELIRHITYPYRKACRYGLPRECFDDYIEVDFEGYKFMGFKKYDLYLTTLYGDYMTLPPVSERKTHPASEIKL